MFELTNIGGSIPIKMALLDIEVGDILIDVLPSEYFLIPMIHIEAKLDIRICICFCECVRT